MARSDADLPLALAGALAASVGDLALLWVAWAGDGGLGVGEPPRGTLLLWAIVAAVFTVGSVVFATAVGRGGTEFPRAFAACNPLLVTAAIAAHAAPSRVLAGFVIPAAPNLAHVVVFTAALLIRGRGPTGGRCA